MDIREFRDTLLRVDNPAAILLLADDYLTSMQKMGDKFVLPREHLIVEPALNYYHGDLEGWVKFVGGVRDRLPATGRKLDPEVHALYRTLLIRLSQQQRRERLSRAVSAAIRKGLIEDTYDDKMRYSRRCTQVWKVRRETMMKSLRQATGRGRLSIGERELELAEFWRLIDMEIEHGELPKP